MKRFFEISAAFFDAGYRLFFDHTQDEFAVQNLTTGYVFWDEGSISDFCSDEPELNVTASQIVALYIRASEQEAQK